MPVPMYEYRCDCGAAFETLVRTSALADRQTCPTCGGDRPRRVLSVFSAPRSTGSDGVSMPTGGGCCGGACGNC